MVKQRHWLWPLLWLLPFFSYAEVTSVSATIDKNPVMLDEAITLVVTAEGDADRDAFDSSKLLSDFVVGRTSVGSQTSIVNFSTRQTTTWSTTLFPRKVGTFTIPAFEIEDKKSAPIAVKVIPVQQGADAPARDYYVTTEVSNETVYLQQQLRYTVKLYLASQIERGSLQAPELENAQIQQLGDDKQYSELVNGKRYQVVERNFAVLPQQSGEFTIRGPVFSGEVIAANTNQRFGFFNRTKTINRVGPDVDVTVKPIPTEIDYHWLPSEFVQLDQEWQTRDFVVGEPVTRTLTLTAVGVVEEQLPEINQIYPPDFKLYPDQAKSATAERDNRLIVQRQESVAMIPTQPGKFIIPEVRVPWYNVKTGKTEYATLPSETITVAPGTTASQALPTTPAPQQSQPEPTMAENEVAQPPLVQSESDSKHNWDIWHVLLLALWLVTLVGWTVTLLKKRKAPIASTTSTPAIMSGYMNDAQLNAVIQQGDIGKIQQAIHRWLSQFSAARRWEIEQQLKPEIDAMMSSAYATAPGQWNKNDLINKIKHINKPGNKKDGELTPLYPTA